MSQERPINFNAEMVQALLDGRKTQTRRVIKDASKWSPHGPEFFLEPGPALDSAVRHHCPYGQPGDRLWCREEFGYSVRNMGGTPHQSVAYRATEPNAVSCYDCNGNGLRMRWQSPIHMPRNLSRIALQIKSIRVERLQDISEADIMAEGCPNEYLLGSNWFKPLWESIKGHGAWDANPWVWVIEFEVMK